MRLTLPLSPSFGPSPRRHVRRIGSPLSRITARHLPGREFGLLPALGCAVVVYLASAHTAALPEEPAHLRHAPQSSDEYRCARKRTSGLLNARGGHQARVGPITSTTSD